MQLKALFWWLSSKIISSYTSDNVVTWELFCYQSLFIATIEIFVLPNSQTAFTCSKSTMETLVNNEKHQNDILESLYKLCTNFTRCSGVSIVDFEQVNASWVNFLKIWKNHRVLSSNNLNYELTKCYIAKILQNFETFFNL